MSTPSREQTATASLPLSSLICALMLKALIRGALGKEGGRNTGTEVTTRAWQEGPQKLRQFVFIMQDEDEDGI